MSFLIPEGLIERIGCTIWLSSAMSLKFMGFTVDHFALLAAAFVGIAGVIINIIGLFLRSKHHNRMAEIEAEHKATVARIEQAKLDLMITQKSSD